MYQSLKQFMISLYIPYISVSYGLAAIHECHTVYQFNNWMNAYSLSINNWKFRQLKLINWMVVFIRFKL